MSENFTYETPVLARIWYEGRRIFEESVIAVECDGEEITVTYEDGEETFEEGDWDELTVQYR